MDTALGIGGGIVAIVIAVFAIVLLILWIVLPFAIFGIGKRVVVLLDNDQAILRELGGIAHELKWANYLSMIAHGLREEKDANGAIRVLRP
jgi:hypothetical protein